MKEARGVTLPEIPSKSREEHWNDYWRRAFDARTESLTASLEREAELREQLAAAQNAALTRENEQSAMDAATVEERFELREQLERLKRINVELVDTHNKMVIHRARESEKLRETERALEMAVDDCYASPQGQVERYVQKARAELAKEKANG
jgi:hypothetical protein